MIAARLPEPPKGCELWDINRLRETGAVAIDSLGRITTTAQTKGRRLWTAP